MVDFFIVLTKNRKKFDKYSKLNKLSKKTVIDIEKLIYEEEINILNPMDLKYFKIMVYKNIMLSVDKNKSVFYLPCITDDFNISTILELSKLKVVKKFNLMLFFNDFKNEL